MLFQSRIKVILIFTQVVSCHLYTNAVRQSIRTSSSDVRNFFGYSSIEKYGQNVVRLVFQTYLCPRAVLIVLNIPPPCDFTSAGSIVLRRSAMTSSVRTKCFHYFCHLNDFVSCIIQNCAFIRTFNNIRTVEI